MSKNIIFCADGTWNGPMQDDNNDGLTDITNVYKLFLDIRGELDTVSLKLKDEQEKTTRDATGVITQVAKYIHGVGDSENFLNKLLGGALGLGIVERIVRGYTFISRNYVPGDKIFLVGFSRGAYTVRALAGLITTSGLLDASKYDLSDRDEGYRLGCTVWKTYREGSGKDQSWLQKKLRDLPAFFSNEVEAQKMITGVEIEAIGVWETVGALGIPQYDHDRRLDLFRFTDTALSKGVKYGRQAIAIDEERIDFTPVFWDLREGVFQALFSGVHADVGGGYAALNQGNGLSDCAYIWMRNELIHLGLNVKVKQYSADFRGQIHCEWGYKGIYKNAPRGLISPTYEGIAIHRSAVHRLGSESPMPVCSPENGNWIKQLYQPSSLRALLESPWNIPGHFRIADDKQV
ncbi:DUF2235 domain-containing protein [Rahnella victoriana]|uniref:DUF2235 domain-containing protein n=1 Tax=Rahnella victoriana TaxID=1510570 RepID=UPI000BB1E0AB|nr:DUF2235 domain-containing protein [Rahnella victoriana]PBI79031.1 hypothetical protein A9993_04520 [Rahnella victoriana]TBX36991.1 DUF2235 domain-containing protein [Rahnella victoriana]